MITSSRILVIHQERKLVMRIQLTIISLTIGFAGVANADNLEVPSDYPTIQSAIDVALNGDVVRVSPGNYFESIDFLGKPIAVIGIGGAEVTGIKAPPNSKLPTVTFSSKESNGTLLSGFKIGGGYGGPLQDSVFGPCIVGAGVYCYEAQPRVESCQFLGNRVDGPLSGIDGHGGGMAIIRSNADVRNCEFIGNQSVGHGGAIYIVGPCEPDIDNCVFEGNEGNWGGAITCTEQASGTITNCTFRANTAFNVGGGLYIRSQSSPVLMDVLFVENVQSGNPFAGGAGVTIYGGGNGGGPCFPQFTDCQFEGNIAEGYGGAVNAAYSGSPTFNNCAFIDNTSGKSGGAISAVGDPAALTDIILDGCSIEQNSAAETGGGIDVRTASLMLQDSVCSGNIAGVQGGGCNFESTNTSIVSMVQNSQVCENVPNQMSGSFSDGGGNAIQETCSICRADLSGDGRVDSEDLGLILVAWGGNGSGDLDENGLVDASDLGLLLVEWGPCFQ